MSVYRVVVQVIDESGAEIVGAAREIEGDVLKAVGWLEDKEHEMVGHVRAMFEHIGGWLRGEHG